MQTCCVPRTPLRTLALFVEASFYRGFEGMEGLNVTVVRRETIPLLWSAVRERASAKGFIFNMGIRSILVPAEEQSCLEGLYTGRSER